MEIFLPESLCVLHCILAISAQFLTENSDMFLKSARATHSHECSCCHWEHFGPPLSLPLVPSDPTASSSFHAPFCNCCLLGLPHLLHISSSAPCQQPLSGWSANRCLFVRNLRSHRIFTLLLSTTFSGGSLQDFWSSNTFTTGVTVNIPGIQWFLAVYEFPGLHPIPCYYMLNCLRGIFAQSGHNIFSSSVYAGVIQSSSVPLTQLSFVRVSQCPVVIKDSCHWYEWTELTQTYTALAANYRMNGHKSIATYQSNCITPYFTELCLF